MSLTGDLITRHEGIRLATYTDTKGLKTVGIGFNLQASGSAAICEQLGLDYQGLLAGTTYLTTDQADAIFQLQLTTVMCQAARIFPTWATMPEKAQAVICDLLFMGVGTFLTFHHTIAALQAGDWDAAAADLEESLWFKEVGTRGVEDVAILRSI